MTASETRKPRVGVFKLASCDGCQLQLLSLEDELLELAAAIEIVTFAEASSAPDDGGRLDLALVEGSVSTDAQLRHLRAVRARADVLVTIGACATAGGIQALRNGRDVAGFVASVYAEPSYIDTLAESTAVRAHVPVDAELRGCPIDRYQLLELIAATLAGRRPQIRDESVCMQCKRAGHVCVMVTKAEPCLGPVTHAGCGALCPGFARGCYGCFGPKERANTASLATTIVPEERVRRFRGFTGGAKAFRDEWERHE